MSSNIQEQGDTPSDTRIPLPLVICLDGTSVNDSQAPLEGIDIEKTGLFLRIYTRSQLLGLHNSPLVQPPSNMPELKSWFGTENEQSLFKKDLDPPTSASARDRRRELEDGDVPSRPPYRSSLTQPSQMGNFKHHSLRVGDRDRDKDRDRDVDKDRERDLRDKEGQERLRHLSDKYDRDRLNLPASNARGKERDVAPHLVSNPSNRTTASGPTSNGNSRRAEVRDASKRKIGESGEDWRRGAEPPRTIREERSETGRRDRDDRERARSRARDPSRSRQEPSTKRERASERDDVRERSSRGDREREDSRREKEDPRRDRERDGEKDVEEDPRRWRDDGKRDERIASRRAREKGVTENTWEGSNDRRWTATEERDGRYKRTSGRDKRPGISQDETKDREDRRDREKEKEPAWMDTYIPNESSPIILGGKSVDGELDGIQAWKKALKDKDKKEKVHASGTKPSIASPDVSVDPPTEQGQQLDEIQLFRLMMQKEKDKRQTDEGSVPSTNESRSALIPHAHSNGENDHADVLRHHQTLPLAADQAHQSLEVQNDRLQVAEESLLPAQNTHFISGHPQDNSKSPSTMVPNTSQLDSTVASERQLSEPSSQFNPPPGSRLLALARAPAKPPIASNPPNTILSNVNHHNSEIDSLRRLSISGTASSLSLGAFSPFEEMSRQPQVLSEPRNQLNQADPSHRSHIDRTHFGNQSHSGSNETHSTDINSNGYATTKGSRFAKFFDGKPRDTGSLPIKSHTPVGYMSPSPNHRQEQGGFNTTHGIAEDRRTMDDIFAMLSNSSQVNNQAPHTHLGGLPSIGHGLPFNAQVNLHLLQQQQQMQSTSRNESLYDSRLEDRSFVPDGMVPGLRTVPPPRNNRDNFSDAAEESLHFNMQRLAQQQRPDPLYPNLVNLPYNQQGNRNGLPLQPSGQPHYRGGPSPSINQQSPPLNSQQRLPPGLANLGGRPPHESPQFLGHPTMTSSGPHNNSPHHNAPFPQQFNTFGSNNIGFNGPQTRAPLPIALQHSVPHLPPSNNLDPRLTNSNFPPSIGGGMAAARLTNNNVFVPHQRIGPQLPPHLGMRPQQSQLPPHILPHLPPNIQSQQGMPGPTNQPAHDLMALLMGGSLRE